MVAGPPRYVKLIAELVVKADQIREKRAFSEVETRIFKLKHTWADDVSLPSAGESGGNIKGVAKMLEDILVKGNSDASVQDKALKGTDEKQV